jgi:hypothetical protein
MIQARITNDAPVIRCYIRHDAPTIKGYIYNSRPSIKGVIHADAPFITAHITKAIDHSPEPYYEVSNEYGTTIIIGD